MLAKPNQSTVTVRPPVVTIMGHIDHGKTTLLDAIRKSKLAAKESGGITQHIGAYQAESQGRKLTFIDTPGHAAFTAMRSRGVKLTDLVVLVIDAVEGVKPQTKECLDHIKAAKVPFLVAINKIDLPNAQPKMVKSQLAENQVLVEGYGGDIVCVDISAKTKKGLNQLLEMILLLAEMQELKADPNGSLEAIVIESTLDRQQGPLATVIVKNGTLKIGDEIQTDTVVGKIKALINESGQNVTKAVPGQPIQILGFKSVPTVGFPITSLKDKPIVDSSSPLPTLLSIEVNLEEERGETLTVILKTDVIGTLEAISQNLPDNVILIAKGVGAVNESDILLAQATKAIVIAFRVEPNTAARQLAVVENIVIEKYQLIHELLDEIAQKVLKLMEPTINEQILGEAKVIAEFSIKGDSIAGCQVTKGKLTKNDLIHLHRKDEAIIDGKIKTIQQNKKSVDQVKSEQECGLSFFSEIKFKIKDKIIAYKEIS